MPKNRIFIAIIALLFTGYLCLGFGYAVYNLFAGPAFDFYTGFEDENFESWTPQFSRQLCCDHSAQIVQDPVRNGQFSLRVQVSPDDPFIKGSKRAEFRSRAVPRNHDYWYAFSMYLPSPWPFSTHPVILAQWHGVPDKIVGEAGRFPPLSVKVIGDELLIESVSGDQWINKWLFLPQAEYTRTILYSEKLTPDIWSDWLFHVVWSPDTDGLVEVWKNGKEIVQLKGPNTYRDLVAPYFKFGVYAYTWGKSDDAIPEGPRVAVYDDIFIRKGGTALSTLTAELRARTGDH